MRKLKVLKKITKEQVINLMNTRKPGLKTEYEELKADYERGDLDHSFDWGNFYNLYDEVEDKIIPGKVVISWINNGVDGCEMIVDSLEELVYYLSEINGAIDVDKSEVEIEVDEGAFADEFEDDDDYEEEDGEEVLEEQPTIYQPIYGKDYRIDGLTREPGDPHLIINAKVAKHDETGWRTDYVKQEVALPLKTVYEILDVLGIDYDAFKMMNLVNRR